MISNDLGIRSIPSIKFSFLPLYLEGELNRDQARPVGYSSTLKCCVMRE